MKRGDALPALADGTGSLPVTVLGGYLGAGKTTLLNRLLRAPHGRRLAVLVNDFGEINIDAALVARRDGETVSLANGCVCCSIGDDLGTTLFELASRSDRPDHIVIESSGVADPARIAAYASCHPRLLLDGIIVVADPQTVRRRSSDKYVGDVVLQQLRAADLVILSRADVTSPDVVREAIDWVSTVAPRTRVQPAPGPDRAASLLVIGAEASGATPAGEARDHAADFATWRFSAHRPVDGAALRAALDGLPAWVLRSKGVLSLLGDPSRRHVLQGIGGRWSLSPAVLDKEPLRSARSEVIVIGLAQDMDRALLERLFDDVAPVPSAVRELLRGREEG